MGNKHSKNISVIYTPLNSQDIPDAIDLHGRFITSAGAKLGNTYLRHLYTTVSDHPEVHRILGAYSKGKLAGFISVTRDAKKTDQLLHNKILNILPRLISGVLCRQFSVRELLDHMAVHRKITQKISQNSIYILGIVVHPQFQRMGIATGLFKAIESIENPDAMFIDTLRTNTEAQKFYTNIGFSPAHTMATSIIYTKYLGPVR